MKDNPLVAIIVVMLLLFPSFVIANGEPCPSCGTIEATEGEYCGRCGAKLLHRISPERALQKVDDRAEAPPLGTLDPSVQQLIGQLSDQEMRRIVAFMLQRLEARQEQFAPDPNSVGQMSRQELEVMLQKYSGSAPPPTKASAFAGFLQFVGGAVLFILVISIIVSI